MELTTPIEINIPRFGTIESADLYLKQEVDKVIAEKDEEIAELKEKYEAMHQAFAKYVVESADRERALKRALYKACVNWAFLAQWERGPLVETWEKWEQMERKCRAMAEEYK